MAIVLGSVNKRSDALHSAHWWLAQQLNLHDIMPDEDKVQLPHPTRRAVWEMYISDVENVAQEPPLIKVHCSSPPAEVKHDVLIAVFICRSITLTF